MKCMYVSHEYLIELAGHLRHSKNSTIDGVACFCECGERAILINRKYHGNYIKIIDVLFHEGIHHLLEYLHIEKLHTIIDFITYSWKIKEGKWVY